MASDAEVLPHIGFLFIVKVVRIAVETVLYGIYLILISFSTTILCRNRLRSKGGIFLLLVTIVMFLASSLFLAMDIADLIQRLQIVMINDPNQSLQEKEDRADIKVENLVWTGEMLFIFLLALGDSVVIWRTWALYQRARRILLFPILTWTGSVVAAFYELGCDIKTGWALLDPNPSAGSVGSQSCAKADTISFSLSYATNILCTGLIFYKTWQFRRSMTRFLGNARRRTQVEKILTLLVESGSIYIALYTFQAIPIYGGSFSSGSFIAVEAVNAVIQQAIGMYPTAIVVLVELQKSLWDTHEVTKEVSDMVFASAQRRSTRIQEYDSRALENTIEMSAATGSTKGRKDHGDEERESVKTATVHDPENTITNLHPPSTDAISTTRDKGSING